MFQFITHPILRRIIEARIKSAFIDRDPNKTRLKQWLTVAYGGQYSAEVFQYQFKQGISLATFGIEISDRLLNISRQPKWYQKIWNPQKYLNESQSYYKSIIQVWSQYKKFENPSFAREEIKLRWYQRLLNWCIKKADLKWEFSNTDISDKELFLKLRTHEGIEPDSREARSSVVANEPTSGYKPNTPSIREKHSVTKLLSSPHIILKRVIEENKDRKTETLDVEEKKIELNTVPPHMQLWLAALTLNQSVDHAHQHVAQQEQKTNLSVTIANLQRIQEAQRWVDNSALNNMAVAVHNLSELKYEASVQWMDALNNACWQEWRKSKEYDVLKKHQLFISTDALEILQNAKGHVRGGGWALDLNSLPLGFFIDKNTAGNIFTLKYNEQYRLHQLATCRDSVVRADVKNPASDFHLNAGGFTSSVTKDDLLRTLNARNIRLKQRHLDFLDTLDRETHGVKFDGAPAEAPYTPTKAFAFRALQCMAESVYPLPVDIASLEEKQDPYLLEFIDILESYSQINVDRFLGYSSTSSYENKGTPSYLNKFILSYLKGMTNGKEYYAEEVRDALKRFAKFNANEHSWLAKIESAQRYYNLNFFETSRGLFYFFDYFNALGMPVPKYSPGLEGRSTLGGFIELKDLLDCISLAGNGKNLDAKRFQAKFTSNIPRQYDVAKTALKSGYAFVHEAMVFGYGNGYAHAYDCKSFDAHIVSRDEFQNMQYGVTHYAGMNDQVYFRAMYLRYIAYHVDPAYFEEAVNKWIEVTGTSLTCFEGTYYRIDGREVKGFDFMDTALRNHWDELKQYALSLPTVMAERKNNNTITANDVSEAFINEKGGLSQLEKEYSPEHIDSLFSKLNLEKSFEQDLLLSIKKINSLSKEYAEMSEAQLEQALKSARTTSLEEQISLLRETHCRLTCAGSKASPPQGEWMRLEQLISILIAVKKDSLLQIDTSEGKTLIIQMIALLKALKGEKVNVLTHNESLALEAGDKIKRLAHLLGVKTAKKNDSVESILDADILYTDISSAVINKMLAAKSLDSAQLPGKRRAGTAIIDEVDNVVIDIHANTTMQISRGSDKADSELEDFLNVLNDVVRNMLPARFDLSDKDSQRNFIRDHLNQKLVDNQFYKKQCANEGDIDKYISAAISAIPLSKRIHYVVEDDNLVINGFTIPRKVVRIIHKETTGRVDKISEWGEYIHQCVAAWEKKDDPAIAIPGIREVLMESDIATYLRDNYVSRVGLTATMGDQPVRDKIVEIIEAKVSVVVPRALRPLGSEANWPIKNRQPDYSRIYRFPPRYAESDAEYKAMLLEGIRNIQEGDYSCIIFFNTVRECDDFFEFLKANKISTQTIQILDDTHNDEKKSAGGSFRPSEATAIMHAKKPRIITLTTAAGSRGTDFDDINVGILAKPNLGRVTIQKTGRIGRNKQFGVVYEIYNKKDLDKTIDPSDVPECKQNPMGYRAHIFAHEKAKEEQNLKTIAARTKTRKTH